MEERTQITRIRKFLLKRKKNLNGEFLISENMDVIQNILNAQMIISAQNAMDIDQRHKMGFMKSNIMSGLRIVKSIGNSKELIGIKEKRRILTNDGLGIMTL